MTKIRSIVFEHVDLQELFGYMPDIPKVDFDNSPGYAGYQRHLNEENLLEWLDQNFTVKPSLEEMLAWKML